MYTEVEMLAMFNRATQQIQKFENPNSYGWVLHLNQRKYTVHYIQGAGYTLIAGGKAGWGEAKRVLGRRLSTTDVLREMGLLQG